MINRIKRLHIIKRCLSQNAATAVTTTTATPATIPDQPSKSPHSGSVWSDIALAPRDPIISINQLYQQDPNPNKINLSIGTYRTQTGDPFIFSSVRAAEAKVFADTREHDKEYSPMEGYHHFNQQAYELLFGREFDDIANVTVQTLAGTGAIDLAATFLGKFYPGRKVVSISQPSWINHYLIFNNYRFNVRTFRYYDNARQTLDSAGLFADIEQLPDHSVVLFQPCGHNPASVQPTTAQWKALSAIARAKNLLPMFDIAYHGLCTGELALDVEPIRQFARDGHLLLVSQSFSKNMSLYADRIGSLTVLCHSADEAYRVRSQLKNLIISKYICPPSQSGRVVAEILCDTTLRDEWQRQLRDISQRLSRTRTQLRRKLEAVCPSPHRWRHITEQSGIFWYSGFASGQVETLINEYSVYLCEDGRVNIAGINDTNIDRLCDVIQDVITR